MVPPGATPGRNRRGRGRGRAAAEDARQETAAAALALLVALLLHLLLEVLDVLVGGLQRLLLHDHRLGQEVGRVGLLAHVVGDEPVGLGVALRGGIVAHAVEHALQQLALFG